MNDLKWDYIGLKFISFATIGVLIWDLFPTQDFLFIIRLLHIVIISVGLFLLFKKKFSSAGNILIIGFDIALLIYGIAGVIFIRSYRPNLMLLYFLRYFLFIFGVVFSQQIFRTFEEISSNIYRILFFHIRLSKRNMHVLIGATSISLFLFVSTASYPMISCSVSGGEYTTGGLIGAEYCLQRYSDGGETCSSSRDCEGDCILSELGSPNDNPVEGVCKPDNDPYGCFSYVEDGKVVGGACID